VDSSGFMDSAGAISGIERMAGGRGSWMNFCSKKPAAVASIDEQNVATTISLTSEMFCLFSARLFRCKSRFDFCKSRFNWICSCASLRSRAPLSLSIF